MASAADPLQARLVMSSRLTLCGSVSRHAVGTGAAMHLAGYRALDLPFTYVPFEVSDLEGAITGMRALGIRGLGISMPYKLDVIALLDAIDPEAQRIGAVNTVVNDGGRLTGHNTDAEGAARAIEEVRAIDGARVLLLGAGGAAKAIAHAASGRGARVTIANRSVLKARAIADAVGGSAAGFDEVTRAAEYDVVINATSMGMREVDPSSPFPEDALRPGLVVMDIVYKPIETDLVRAAKRRSALVIHGGRMLLHQAARQFELYTQRPAPLAAMDAALRAQIG